MKKMMGRRLDGGAPLRLCRPHWWSPAASGAHVLAAAASSQAAGLVIR